MARSDRRSCLPTNSGFLNERNATEIWSLFYLSIYHSLMPLKTLLISIYLYPLIYRETNIFHIAYFFE